MIIKLIFWIILNNIKLDYLNSKTLIITKQMNLLGNK